LAYSETGSPNGEGELFIGTAGPAVTKITTTVLTGVDGVAAQPNSSAQNNQTITTGLGIDGADAGDAGNITISFDPNELTPVAPVTTDYFIFEDVTDSLPKKQLASAIPLSIFDNDLTFLTAEVDTLASVTGRAATTAVASTFSGGINMADSDLNRPVLEDYGVKHQAPTVSANAVTINLTLGNSVLVDMDPATAAVVVTLTNPPPSGIYGEVNIAVVMGTPAWGITWPGSVVWMSGGAPTLTTTNDVVDLVHLFTVDAGTTWYGTYSLAAAGASGTLSGLTDTTITAPADAALLLYDTGTAMWRDATMSGDASIGDTGIITVSNSAALGGSAAANYALIANAVMQADTSTAGWAFVLDEDAMGSDSATKLATQQSIKAYVDNAVTGALTHKGGYNAATNTPALDTGSPVLEIGDMYTVTAAGTFFTVALEIGDVLISDVASVDAALITDWTIVQSNIGAASETVAGYIQIATQAEMDTATNDLKSVTPLKYASSTIDGGTF
jgi:hypothetical protein